MKTGIFVAGLYLVVTIFINPSHGINQYVLDAILNSNGPAIGYHGINNVTTEATLENKVTTEAALKNNETTEAALENKETTEAASVVAKSPCCAVKPKAIPPSGKMPAVGLGTWQANDKELETALEAALEAGYRHIDTAFVYKNEAVIGTVLKRWLDAGKLKRDDLFIVTKLPPGGMRPSGVAKYLGKSLKDLQLDYVDLYLIHTPFAFPDDDDAHPTDKDGNAMLDKTTDHVATWKAMEEQVDLKKTRAIGLSNFNETQIQRVLDTARIKPEVLQIELHAYHQQRPLVDFCKEKGIVVTAYSPLGSPGLGKFLQQFGQNVTIPNILHNPVVKEVADKHNKSASQVLLRHSLQRDLIVIPKSTNADRLQQNLDVFDFELDADDVKKINDLDKGNAGRLVDFKAFKGIEAHPEYPFHDK